MINSQASDWFPFIVLVVVLIVSPRGLFSAGNLFRFAHAPLRRRRPKGGRGNGAHRGAARHFRSGRRGI